MSEAVEVNDLNNSCLVLPEVMDISAAEGIKNLFLGSLSGEGDIVIDASKVEKFTSPAIQLLVALEKSLEGVERNIVINNPSETFQNSCKILGITEQYNKWVGEDE